MQTAPKYININIDDGYIKWNKDTINSNDRIILETKNRSMPTSLLYTILKHPSSKFEELLQYNQNIRLYVSYWTLYDIRNKELDGNLNDNDNIIICNENNLGPDKCSRRDQLGNSLTETETNELFIIIQTIKELHVFVDKTNVRDWSYLLKSRYVGVIRSFLNITDIDHCFFDKYGWCILELTESIYNIWNVKTHNIVRYHGSDDGVDGNITIDTYNYYHTGDLGFTNSSCSDIIESLKESLNDLYINVTESLYMRCFEIEATPCTPALKDIINFPNLRNVRIDAKVKLYAKDAFIDINNPKYIKYWIIDIPGSDLIKSFKLTLDISLEDNQDPTQLYLVKVQFGKTPNLHNIYNCFYSSMKDISDNIHVYVNIPDNFDKIIPIKLYS